MKSRAVTAPGRGGLPAREKIRRVALVCPYGIGNLVMTLPALRTLRCGFPDLEIHLVSLLPGTTEMLRTFPLLEGLYDRLHEVYLPKGAGSLAGATRSIMRLRRVRPDVGLLSFPTFSFHYNLLNYLIGAPVRVGWEFPDDRVSRLHWLNTVRLRVQEGLHDVEQNLNLVRTLGEPKTEYRDLSWAQAAFRREKEPLIGIHAGCKKGHRYKQWDPANFASVVERLLAGEAPPGIRMFFGPDELDQLPFFQGRAWSGRVEFVHSKGLPEVLRLIEECGVFLSNDSGLMHLAVLTGCPHVIAVVGPSDPLRTGPFDPRAVLLKANLPCMPCSHSYTAGSRDFHCSRARVKECLSLVTVDEVTAAVHKALQVRPGE